MVLSRTVRHVGNSDTAMSEFLEIENQIDGSFVFGWLSGLFLAARLLSLRTQSVNSI
jgi:hypothetical protein